jgi:hypothetical protein
MLLSKGMKSLQLSLSELVPKLRLRSLSVTGMAYSKARLKLKHTAFIALNKATVVDVMYSDKDYQTLYGYRILAVDGSKIQLPTNKDTVKEFGSFTYSNDRPDVTGEHSYALASVLYDVLNKVAIDAKLEQSHSYEVDIAATHLQYTEATDLVIYDRGYCSFRMMALAYRASSEFLIRCHGNSFSVVNDMLDGKGPDDIVCTINPSKRILVRGDKEQMRTPLTVRFIRVTLDDGTIEVLATSLLDQALYPLNIFKDLYYYRWGLETFYGILKTRLCLENFSGYSPEAIRQDFFATILLTGIESIFTEDAEDTLSRSTSGHPKKVNKAVSFNTIKNHAFDLLLSNKPSSAVLNELTELFTYNPTLIRKDRNPPRKKNSDRKILGFWKRKRKAVF